MPTLNFLVFLNAYGDTNPSNNPSMSNFKWDREISGLSVNNPQSSVFSLAPGESKTLFNGTRTLSSDNTTQYSLALKTLTSNTYVITRVGGTAPQFRTPRTTGAAANTVITVTQNGPLAIFTSTSGTNLALISGGVVVGDYVRIGTQFNSGNQGEWKILALTATGFTVENELAVPEAVTLGGTYATLQIYSAAGVQIGDMLDITSGFSSVTQGSYRITSVSSTFIEFFSADALPAETITNPTLSVYSSAKQLVYVESDQRTAITLNGVSGNEVKPFVVGSSTQPGVFMRSSTVWSMVVTNNGTDTANVFVASVE